MYRGDGCLIGGKGFIELECVFFCLVELGRWLCFGGIGEMVGFLVLDKGRLWLDWIALSKTVFWGGLLVFLGGDWGGELNWIGLILLRRV